MTFRLFGLVDGAAVLTGRVTRAAKLPPRREAQVRDPRLVEDAERLEVGSSGAQSELTQALAATEPGPSDYGNQNSTLSIGGGRFGRPYDPNRPWEDEDEMSYED